MPLAWAAFIFGGILLVSAFKNQNLVDTALGRQGHLEGGSPSDVAPTITAAPPADGGGSTPGVIDDLISALGYVNPFAGSLVHGGRIDEGLDPTIKGPIRAVGNAKVVAVKRYSGFGDYVVYQLLDGSMAGHRIYISEGIVPHVHVGQTVKAGQVIATGTGAIETGWAGPGPTFLPEANKAQGGNYTEGKVTDAGRRFNDFLKKLNVHAGPD